MCQLSSPVTALVFGASAETPLTLYQPDALAQEHGIYNTSSLWQLLNQAKRDAQLICRLVLTNQGWKASPGTNSQFHYTSLAMQ